MEKPLVSINIPVYKVEKYIERCLESVLNQSYKNIELILVNDQSPDNSIIIAQNFLEKNTHNLSVKIFHNKTNSGLSATRNKAIKESAGKYIYMLDSDDYITTECIEKLVAIAEKNESEIVVGETICFDSKSKQEKMLFPIKSKQEKIVTNKIIFEEFIKNMWPIIGPNKLYKRSFIIKNNLAFVKNLYSQDELWAFHCALKLNSISFLKDITYIYYLHNESTIFNKTKINFENHQTIAEHFAKAYYECTNTKRKKLIIKKLIGFRNTTLIMQWKSMRKDVVYWKENYSRLKKLPSLSFFDYFSPEFSLSQKKENLLQNLPTDLGYKLFKWRYER